MKRFTLLTLILFGFASLGLGLSEAKAIDSICLSENDEVRDSQDDYDCLLQMRKVLLSNGLLQVNRTQRIRNLKTYFQPGDIYVPPVPNYPYVPPVPNYPIFVPPVPN